MRRFILALLALVLMMSYSGAVAETPTPAPAPMDSAIGAFSTVDLAGGAVDSNIFAGSKLTLVNVWATFCGYCVDEMPDLAKLDAEYENLQVLGILGDAGSKDAVDPNNLDLGKEIAEKTGAVYVNILPDSIINEKLMAYISAYPTSFFVDRNGQIVGKAIAGAMGYDDWKKVIDERMAQVEAG